MAIPVLFDLTLAHGRCVAVAFDAIDALGSSKESTLGDEEKAYAATLGERRRRTWIGGRLALREALAREGIAHGSILSTPRGAPLLPEGVTGSVSHKDDLAVALVARARTGGDDARIGVDVEVDAPRKHDVSSYVLTEDEVAELASLDAADKQRAVLLRFSAKESIYKAIDPFVQRYVSFKEAHVTPADDGSARVVMSLRPEEGAFDVEVRWLRRDGLILTTARARRR